MGSGIDIYWREHRWSSYDDVMMSTLRLVQLLIQLNVLKYIDFRDFEKKHNLLEYAERNWKVRIQPEF